MVRYEAGMRSWRIVGLENALWGPRNVRDEGSCSMWSGWQLTSSHRSEVTQNLSVVYSSVQTCGLLNRTNQLG